MNNKHVCKVLAFKHVSACGRSCAHVLASLVASDYWLFAHSLIHSFIRSLSASRCRRWWVAVAVVVMVMVMMPIMGRSGRRATRSEDIVRRGV